MQLLDHLQLRDYFEKKTLNNWGEKRLLQVNLFTIHVRHFERSSRDILECWNTWPQLGQSICTFNSMCLLLLCITVTRFYMWLYNISSRCKIFVISLLNSHKKLGYYKKIDVHFWCLKEYWVVHSKLLILFVIINSKFDSVSILLNRHDIHFAPT